MPQELKSIKYIQIVFHESILPFNNIIMVLKKKLVIGHAYKRVVDLLSIPSCSAVYWCAMGHGTMTGTTDIIREFS